MRPWIPVLAIGWLAAGPVGAGAAVVFEDGRSIQVEFVERVDDVARLRLEGGGALTVPAERIANWDELARADFEPPEPAAVEVAEPPVDDAWREAAGPYAEFIAHAAERHGVEPALLVAMAEVESAFDPLAVSPKGASGLLQLMPATADRFGVHDVFDVAQNVDGAARYLSWLLERYEGRTDLALAGYNAGEGAVDRHSGVPPYRETRSYVRRVLDGATRLADLAP